ncbi:uncharacterized protein F4822DRAFT_97572 [Hypoxylon trugodes]|uniref:uncharacterized protein n=1 Tax=Hypoxylon trugodes TaxID=326681 RepID=UPI0021927838|nr:uncharacterized protein F4822DRAFT_97572 [Hypoxylon trugodes]KAI1382806.1 hypothetical protein F4822DRAFT_97572 [Hypoxylon trugodes]
MEDSEDTAAAMAQAMGFSSFGAQHNSNKRRKFNPRADAVVASTSTSTIPLHHNGAVQEVSSGSNATPLGVRTRNPDEVDLGDDEDETDFSNNVSRSSPKNADDPEPQYLDTSRPPTVATDDPNDDIQSKIDTILGEPSIRTFPMFGTGDGSRSRGGHTGNQVHRSHGHGSGDKWWEDYYDPSSNVNPWDRLEQSKGLEPRGSWMSWEEAKR